MPNLAKIPILACLIFLTNPAHTHIKILAKGLAFHLDRLLPHLISQDWAVFVRECKTSGNLRQLSMSLSSLMLLKHCYIITMEPGKTFVVWNKIQKTWILTKFRHKEDIFPNGMFSPIIQASSTGQLLPRSLLRGQTPRKELHKQQTLGIREPSSQRCCSRVTWNETHQVLTQKLIAKCVVVSQTACFGQHDMVCFILGVQEVVGSSKRSPGIKAKFCFKRTHGF